jgi:CRP-like cAMP-binding protein
MSFFEFFLKLSLFKGVDQNDLFSLIPRITLDFEEFQGGTMVFDRQTQSKGVVYLLSGRVKGTSDDRTMVFSGESLLSFSGLFGSKGNYLMDVVALEDSRVLVIDAKSLTYLLQNNTTILNNYLELLSDAADARKCQELLKNRYV